MYNEFCFEVFLWVLVVGVGFVGFGLVICL